MKILQFILLALFLSAGSIHIYVMDRSNNDFVDLKITGQNLSVVEVSEIANNRTVAVIPNIGLWKYVLSINDDRIGESITNSCDGEGWIS